MFCQKEVRIPTIRRKTWTIVATSIKIKPEVWKQAKIEAIRRDMELSELVEQAIEAYGWEMMRERRKTRNEGSR